MPLSQFACRRCIAGRRCIGCAVQAIAILGAALINCETKGTSVGIAHCEAGGGVIQVEELASASDRVENFALLGKLEGLSNHVYGLAFNEDGSRLAAGDTTGKAAVWTFPGGKLMARFSTGEAGDSIFHALALSANGKLLFAGDETGRLFCWDVDQRDSRWVIQAHDDTVQDLVVSPDGSTVITCGSDEVVHVWNVADGTKKKTLTKQNYATLRMVVPADGETVIVGGSRLLSEFSLELREIDVESGEVAQRYTLPPGEFFMLGGLELSPDGSLLAAQGYKGGTQLFRRPDGEKWRHLETPRRTEYRDYSGNDVAFHPSGKICAVAYRDPKAKEGLVACWNFSSGKIIKQFDIFFAVADNVEFSPDGKYLAATGAGSWVAVFGDPGDTDD